MDRTYHMMAIGSSISLKIELALLGGFENGQAIWYIYLCPRLSPLYHSQIGRTIRGFQV